MEQSITEHEGKKYLRRIRSALASQNPIDVDVYCVLRAYNVTDAPIAHAVKKLLCCGNRGKGDKIADLKGVLAAVNRALDMAQEDVLMSDTTVVDQEDAGIAALGHEFPGGLTCVNCTRGRRDLTFAYRRGDRSPCVKVNDP